MVLLLETFYLPLQINFAPCSVPIELKVYGFWFMVGFGTERH